MDFFFSTQVHGTGALAPGQRYPNSCSNASAEIFLQLVHKLLHLNCRNIQMVSYFLAFSRHIHTPSPIAIVYKCYKVQSYFQDTHTAIASPIVPRHS